MRRLADYHIHLSCIHFPQIGSVSVDKDDQCTIGPLTDHTGPYDRAIDFYLAEADRLAQQARTVEVEAALEREQRLFVAWLYRTAIVNVDIIGDGNGPFPLSSNDLHVNNTVVDEYGNIVAILDWDGASTVPIENFAIPSLHFGHFQSPHPEYRARTMRFNQALEEEARQNSPPWILSGKSLTELHRSSRAMIALLSAHLLSSDCRFTYAQQLCGLLSGEEVDVEALFKHVTVP